MTLQLGSVPRHECGQKPVNRPLDQHRSEEGNQSVVGRSSDEAVNVRDLVVDGGESGDEPPFGLGVDRLARRAA
jgi:hypothetical protein